MDKDRYIGNDPVKKISNAEISAFHRGKDDRAKSERLSMQKLKKVMSDEALYSMVDSFANGLHLEQLALKFGLSRPEISTILETLGISSSADARNFIANKVDNSLASEAKEKKRHAEAQKRLEKENKRLEEATNQTPEVSRKEVNRKNKLDKVREMLSKKINKTNFTVEPAMEREFKSLAVYGLNAIRRKFGQHLTDAQIKLEIKRLIPGMNLDLVRP